MSVISGTAYWAAITNPNTTSRHDRQTLLSEQSRLERTINDLRHHHRKIEHVPEAANRAHYILRKITRLEIQLHCVRSIAREFDSKIDSAKMTL